MKKLVIIGAGESATLAYEYFTHDSEYEVVAFAVNKDYIKEDNFNGKPLVQLENIEELYPNDEYDAFVALSSTNLNYARSKIYKEIKSKGYSLPSYVSSKAFVWHNVEIGDNCFILENNVLQPFTRVGNNVTMWSGNHLGHRSIIKDNCFISSHVVISGFCEIGENTFMGVNSCVADNVKIARDNFITMGCVINQDTQENRIYKSTPPPQISKVTSKQFFRVKD